MSTGPVSVIISKLCSAQLADRSMNLMLEPNPVTKKVGLSLFLVFRLFTVSLTKPLTLFVFAIYETCLPN